MNPRHCHLNLEQQRYVAFVQRPDLRRKWRSLYARGALLGLSIVVAAVAYLVTQ